MTTPTPERAADPTPEARKAAFDAVEGWLFIGDTTEHTRQSFAALDQRIARALDAFAKAAVEKERKRCLRHVFNACGDADIGQTISARICSGEQP